MSIGTVLCYTVLQAQSFMRVPYKHLHADLKRLMRTFGIRPSRNQCFGNCQQIMLAAEKTPLEERLVYHEGWVVCSADVPIRHAWLVLDGAHQDPTLNHRQPEHYMNSNTYTVAQIRQNVQASGMWQPINPRALDELMFPAADMEKLKALRQLIVLSQPEEGKPEES